MVALACAGSFLAHYLKGESVDVAPVTAFQSGSNEWQRLKAWPAQPATTKLYLKPDQALGLAPASGTAVTAEYVSDPAHPVTFVPRPILPVGYEDDHWTDWLTTDQRNASARPDVLTFTSEVLSTPLTIAGQPIVHLTASTSGTDSDWVVKLIDVYPDQVPVTRAMGGYQFAVGMDIFRGRYRVSLSNPQPITPNMPLAYSFALPRPTASSCLATGSWRRCSRAGCRFMTAIPKPLCRTSSSPCPRIIRRRHRRS